MTALFFSGGRAVQDLIPEGYSLQMEYSVSLGRSTIVDTYDWRLWNSGYTALVNEGGLELRDLETWATDGGRNGAGNVAAGPDSQTAEKIKKIIYPRMLVRRFEVSRQIETCVIRNLDEKIVCKAEAVSLKLENARGAKAKGILFHPLKGYEEETGAIEKYARRAAVRADTGTNQGRGNDPLSVLLENQKENPGSFLSHKSLHLENGMPLQKASCALLLRFADVMADCVPGILEGVDSEFLHDYRVCVRKSRAFLSLLKSLLDTEAVSPHISFLKRCGNMTTGMRDLDVYLLEFPVFYNLLPPTLNTHLEAFYDEIQTKREAAGKKLSTDLENLTYTADFAAWRKFLQSGGLIAAGKETTSDILGRRLISDRYKKVRKLAGRITEQTADPDLHALRIECKKLRYCIEFFKSAVHEPVVDEVLSLLKTLQDVLGEFNDLSVQQQWLDDALHSQEVVRTPGVQAAIGGLMTTLYAKQQGLRQRVFEKFTGFVDVSVAKRIMKLKDLSEA